MSEKYIFFDLDGTVSDSSEGVFAGVRHALGEMGWPEPPAEDMGKFIGPPLRESFQKLCGMTAEESERAITLYREMYSVSGIFMFRIYPGVETMLSKLAKAGFPLAVATSKPEPYARRMLERAGLSRYFTYIAGADFAGPRTDKPAVIEYALSALNITPEQALMVGDRRHDVEGAHTFGMRCAGILWGFGSREEFAACHADFVCETPEALTELILNLPKEGTV